MSRPRGSRNRNNRGVAGTNYTAGATVSSNASAGDGTSASLRIDPTAPSEIQGDLKASPESVNIADANPGFTAPVEGPQETGPGATVEPTTGEPLKRPRGRPPGSTNRKPVSASGVETLLLGIHATLRAATGAEEFDLSRDEAKQLANAYADVAEYYPALNFDPKYAALANLAGVISIVYGSRFVTWRMKRAMNKRPASPVMPRQPVHTATQNGQPVMPENMFGSPQINGVDPMSGERRDVPQEARKSVIPGVGEVEFPPDHPMVNGKPN